MRVVNPSRYVTRRGRERLIVEAAGFWIAGIDGRLAGRETGKPDDASAAPDGYRWTPQQREKTLPLVIDKPRFPILPCIAILNLGSHILSLVCRRLLEDWTERYNVAPAKSG